MPWAGRAVLSFAECEGCHHRGFLLKPSKPRFTFPFSGSVLLSSCPLSGLFVCREGGGDILEDAISWPYLPMSLHSVLVLSTPTVET
jgi:hypothetical protein